MCKGLAVRLSPGHLANLGSECHLQGTEREGRSHRPWGVVTRKGTQSELIFSVSQGLIREDREVEGSRDEVGGREAKEEAAGSLAGQARVMAGKRAKPSGFPAVSDTVKEEGRE